MVMHRRGCRKVRWNLHGTSDRTNNTSDSARLEVDSPSVQGRRNVKEILEQIWNKLGRSWSLTIIRGNVGSKPTIVNDLSGARSINISNIGIKMSK
jgi:hypothetical protein